MAGERHVMCESAFKKPVDHDRILPFLAVRKLFTSHSRADVTKFVLLLVFVIQICNKKFLLSIYTYTCTHFSVLRRKIPVDMDIPQSMCAGFASKKSIRHARSLSPSLSLALSLSLSHTHTHTNIHIYVNLMFVCVCIFAYA